MHRGVKVGPVKGACSAAKMGHARSHCTNTTGVGLVLLAMWGMRGRHVLLLMLGMLGAFWAHDVPHHHLPTYFNRCN
jgi:hypothetical protein